MSKVSNTWPNIVFWTALILSILNIIAGILGFPKAVHWALGTELPLYLLTPIAVMIWGALIISFVSSLMGNASAMLIYGANLLTAPFFYETIGIPYGIGLCIAILPYPLYFWVQSVFQLIDSIKRR